MKHVLILIVFLAGVLAAVFIRRNARNAEARMQASAAPQVQPEAADASAAREELRLPLLTESESEDTRAAQVDEAVGPGSGSEPESPEPSFEEPAKLERSYEDLVASYLISLAPECPSAQAGTVSIQDCGGCHTPPDEQTVRVWAETQISLQPLSGHVSLTDALGNVLATGSRRYGKREGPWTEYREDGSVLATGAFLRDRRHGPWTQWSETGKVEAEGSYAYGSREGSWTEFDEQGERARSAEYRLGELDGRVVEWHPGGKTVSREAEYYAGRLDGRERTFHANGKPASDGHYANGMPTGTWNYWDENGNLDEARSGPTPPP